MNDVLTHSKGIEMAASGNPFDWLGLEAKGNFTLKVSFLGKLSYNTVGF